MDIVSILKAAKKQKRMTATEIADISSVPFSTVNKIFSGVIDEPKFSTVLAIAKALDCPVFSLSGEDPAASLPQEERELITSYRALDDHGKQICDFILKKEAERCAELNEKPQDAEQADVLRSAEIISNAEFDDKINRKIRLRLFDLPASAGCGEPLFDSSSSHINVPESPTTAVANFAVRVNGQSMEPDYHTGDILLIREQCEVLPGELGLFIADGEGYFKKFGGDRLISLNPQYDDIMISSFGDFSCRGKVIGKLRKKSKTH